jgi:redox-sensing transcriptional repressor
MNLSEQAIERLAAMRRYLRVLERGGQERVFSHELTRCWRASATQVRRDLMLIGYHGSNARGYDVAGLRAHIGEILPTGSGAALVGVGQLGRALLSYFGGRGMNVEVRSAFDVDPAVVGRDIHGCRCHHVGEMESVLAIEPVDVGIVTVPAEVAQGVATRLVRSGVRGVVNFAPVLLDLPAGVFVQKIDLAVLLEKTAYFASDEPSHAGAVPHHAGGHRETSATGGGR